MFTRLLFIVFYLLLQQGLLPCSADECLFTAGFYGGADDKSETFHNIWKTVSHADSEISFAGTQKVQFLPLSRGELEYYSTPEKILEELKLKSKKELLVIHLEKRFDYWMKPEQREKEENKIIEFGKKAEFRRCLILIASAFGVGVLADFRNDTGASLNQ